MTPASASRRRSPRPGGDLACVSGRRSSDAVPSRAAPGLGVPHDVEGHRLPGQLLGAVHGRDRRSGVWRPPRPCTSGARRPPGSGRSPRRSRRRRGSSASTARPWPAPVRPGSGSSRPGRRAGTGSPVSSCTSRRAVASSSSSSLSRLPFGKLQSSYRGRCTTASSTAAARRGGSSPEEAAGGADLARGRVRPRDPAWARACSQPARESLAARPVATSRPCVTRPSAPPHARARRAPRRRTLRRRRRSRWRRAEPLAGDDRVLVLAEHVLDVGDARGRTRGPACRRPGRPPRRRSGPLGPDADRRAARRPADRRRSASTASRSSRHGRRTEARITSASSSSSMRSSRRGRRAASDESVEQRGVPIAAQRARSSSPRSLGRGRTAGRSSSRSAGRPVDLGERRDLALEELEQHLGVAHGAELGAEPAQLVAQPLAHSSTSERNVRRSERSRRVATRAWCTCSGSSPSRTPGSWASRRSDRRWRCARRTTIVDARMSRAEAGGDDVRRFGRGAGRARGRSSGVGSGAPAPARRSRASTDRAMRVGSPDLAELDLELAERRRSRRPRRRRTDDLVVDDLARASCVGRS